MLCDGLVSPCSILRRPQAVLRATAFNCSLSSSSSLACSRTKLRAIQHWCTVVLAKPRFGWMLIKDATNSNNYKTCAATEAERRGTSKKHRESGSVNEGVSAAAAAAAAVVTNSRANVDHQKPANFFHILFHIYLWTCRNNRGACFFRILSSCDGSCSEGGKCLL